MAGLDPNIALGIQQPQFQNPMDVASKAMALQNLSMNNQQQKMQYNDSLALRHAQDNATTVNPDGSYSMDQNKMLTELGQTAPHMVPQAAMSIQQQKLTMQQNQMKQLQDHATVAAQTLSGINDQASYDQGKVIATQMGYPTDSWPKNYDPDWVKTQAKNAAYAAMNPHDAMTSKMEEQKIGIQEKEADIKSKELQIALNKPKQEAFKDLMSHAESSRQLPDVKQAYTDRYNTQKILDLVGSGDPNKLNPNMVQLLSSEVGKVATGAAPTEETLKNLTPQDAKMIQARTQQYLTSHPEAGQQGAFVSVFKDYAKTIQEGANKVIDSNMGKLGSSYKQHIDPDDYSNFQKNYVKGTVPPAEAGTVNVRLPDGRTGTIPKSNLEKALSMGAKQL